MYAFIRNLKCTKPVINLQSN